MVDTSHLAQTRYCQSIPLWSLQRVALCVCVCVWGGGGGGEQSYQIDCIHEQCCSLAFHLALYWDAYPGDLSNVYNYVQDYVFSVVTRDLLYLLSVQTMYSSNMVVCVSVNLIRLSLLTVLLEG